MTGEAPGGEVGGMDGQTAVRGTLVITPKGPADGKPDAKVLNRILQMDGETVARELPAEHQLIADAWGCNILIPSMVYMPEKDRLLLRYVTGCNPWCGGLEDLYPMQISSDDHGKTWHNPVPRGNANECKWLSYLGEGELLEAGEGTRESQNMRSRDYGETWASLPSPPASSGFPFYTWDPCLADRDPDTGALERVAVSGYSQGMERQFEHARKVVVLPNEWHWRHDPEKRGITDEWHKDEALSDWPRMMRIDEHWTMQGEPAGVGWYATNFETPDTGGIPLAVCFGAVDGYCDVFIDGTKVGEQKKPPEIMWTRPFHLALRDGLSAGTHTMVIRVEKESAEESNAGIYLPVWIVEDTGRKAGEEVVSWPRQHALIRFSYDGGGTWPEEIQPPSWNGASGVGVNEVALCRAANGDIVAACRIVHPDYFGGKADPERHTTIDHYCGLGVSVSRDNGHAWTSMDVLYEYGHMHPSMVLMPDDTLVMTYVVRRGALKEEHRARDADGFSQWGVEAVVSRDNGATWDMDHRYILATWSGGSQAQSTSTVLLADGSLLTAFGSGYLSQPVKLDIAPTHEVCLVRWRPTSCDYT